jgi:hypothetical protein
MRPGATVDLHVADCKVIMEAIRRSSAAPDTVSHAARLLASVRHLAPAFYTAYEAVLAGAAHVLPPPTVPAADRALWRASAFDRMSDAILHSWRLYADMQEAVRVADLSMPAVAWASGGADAGAQRAGREGRGQRARQANVAGDVGRPAGTPDFIQQLAAALSQAMLAQSGSGGGSGGGGNRGQPGGGGGADARCQLPQCANRGAHRESNCWLRHPELASPQFREDWAEEIATVQRSLVLGNPPRAHMAVQLEHAPYGYGVQPGGQARTPGPGGAYMALASVSIGRPVAAAVQRNRHLAPPGDSFSI